MTIDLLDVWMAQKSIICQLIHTQMARKTERLEKIRKYNDRFRGKQTHRKKNQQQQQQVESYTLFLTAPPSSTLCTYYRKFIITGHLSFC